MIPAMSSVSLIPALLATQVAIAQSPSLKHFVSHTVKGAACELDLLAEETAVKTGQVKTAFALPTQITLESYGPDGDPTNSRPSGQFGSQTRFIAHLKMDYSFRALSARGCDRDVLAKDSAISGFPRILPAMVSNMKVTLEQLHGIKINTPPVLVYPEGTTIANVGNRVTVEFPLSPEVSEQVSNPPRGTTVLTVVYLFSASSSNGEVDFNFASLPDLVRTKLQNQSLTLATYEDTLRQAIGEMMAKTATAVTMGSREGSALDQLAKTYMAGLMDDIRPALYYVDSQGNEPATRRAVDNALQAAVKKRSTLHWSIHTSAETIESPPIRIERFL
jgi:hypothetical protein